MFTNTITRIDYNIYVSGDKPLFVNICWKKIGDQYEILVRSTVHALTMNDQLYKCDVNEFANRSFDEIKDLGGHKIFRIQFYDEYVRQN